MKITLTNEEKAFAKTITVSFALESPIDLFGEIEYGAWVNAIPGSPAGWFCMKLDKRYSNRSVTNAFIQSAYADFQDYECFIRCELKEKDHEEWVDEAYKNIKERREEMKKWLHE